MMSTTRRPLIAGNWKMNCLLDDGLALAGDLLRRLEGTPDLSCDLLICPPNTLLEPIAGLLGHGTLAQGVLAQGTLVLGAQDCHAQASGAFTGDAGAPMLADLGCRYVICGHSERRAGHGETDEMVRAKATAAIGSGLTAIVCLGESEAARDSGRAASVVEGQLRGSVPDGPGGGRAETLVIAYEPVWAIGTGRNAGLAEIAEIHALIRQTLASLLGRAEAKAMRILYGGSVKPDNACHILGLDDVDGALVGGASLKAEDFWAIAQSCP